MGAGLVDEKGQKGLKYGDIGMVYSRAVKNLAKRKQERVKKKKQKAKDSPKKEAEEIVGRADFEILMEELQDVPGVKKAFLSPMLMVVHMATKANADGAL